MTLRQVLKKGVLLMKNMKRVLLVVLAVVAVFSLVSCSSFGKIKKAFTDAGYEYVNVEDNESAKTIAASYEDSEVSCTVHLFKAKNIANLDAYAVVLEFKSNEEAAKQLSENNTLTGFFKDLQKSDLVNDNCVLIPLSLLKAEDMITTFKNA